MDNSRYRQKNREREIDSDAVTRPFEEKQGTDSKNVTSADTKYFLVDGL